MGGHPCAASSPWKWPDLPSSRRNPCRRAHAPATPEEPGGACLDAPPGAATVRGTSVASSTGLSRLDRMARRLAVYASSYRLPVTTQDSLPAARLRFAGRGFHPPGLRMKGFSYVSVSHVILLSRACLAQSPYLCPKLTGKSLVFQVAGDKTGEHFQYRNAIRQAIRNPSLEKAGAR